MADRGVPFIAIFFTLLATISILLFVLPGLVQSMPRNLWLANANITSLNDKVLPALHVDPTIAKALAWGDYVSFGLWGTCAHQEHKNPHGIMCMPPSISYSIHPASVWSLSNGTAKVDLTLPKKLLNVLEDQRIQTILIKIFYLTPLGLSTVCIILGSIAACAGRRSRHPAFKRRLLGYISLLTSISTIMLFAGAATATRGYGSLLDVMNDSFGEYILFTLGDGAMAMLWVSALLTMLATILWVQSWRREQRYKPIQGARGTTAWLTGDNKVFVDEEPSADGGDEKTLLEKDTSYHSPTRR